MDLLGCLGGAMLGVILAALAVFDVYPRLAHIHDDMPMGLIFLFPLVALPVAVVCGIFGAMIVEIINRKSKRK